MNVKRWVFLMGSLSTVAGCRDTGNTASHSFLHEVSLNQDTPGVQKSACPRPFLKSGIPVRGLVTAADSSSFSLTEMTPAGTPSRRFVFAFYGCLPIESAAGDSLPFSSLVPGRSVLVWLGPAMRPTQPIQAVAEGVQIEK
jgi:hypothetical protein